MSSLYVQRDLNRLVSAVGRPSDQFIFLALSTNFHALGALGNLWYDPWASSASLRPSNIKKCVAPKKEKFLHKCHRTTIRGAHFRKLMRREKERVRGRDFVEADIDRWYRNGKINLARLIFVICFRWIELLRNQVWSDCTPRWRLLKRKHKNAAGYGRIMTFWDYTWSELYRVGLISGWPRRMKFAWQCPTSCGAIKWRK